MYDPQTTSSQSARFVCKFHVQGSCQNCLPSVSINSGKCQTHGFHTSENVSTSLLSYRFLLVYVSVDVPYFHEKVFQITWYLREPFTVYSDVF